ncbi:YadA-like family protein [Megasphaera massiliensis]|uniref:YadA-like family protein n=1 Tax=Megasphaera massiliensis TaxID=1232428 RepID=UPI003AB44D05
MAIKPFNGDSDVKGNSHVGKDLTVDGTSTLNGDVAMNGNASVAKDLTVSGNTNLKDTVVDGTFKATGDAAFGSDIDVAGNGHIGKDLTVDGTSTLNGDVAMKGNASIDKDLSVSGTTNLKDTVIDGTLETTGNAVFNANTDVKGNSHIGKNLTVEGTSDLKGDVSMGSNALIKKNLGVGGNAYIDGDLYVHGYNYIDSQGINANDFRIRNVADGAILPGSTDAINGGQLYNTRVDLTNKIERVGAGAAALAGLHPGEYDPDNKLDFAAGYGHYKGANAGAIGVFYHPNEDTTVSLSGTMGNGDPMLSAGVSFKLGPSGTNTMSRTALTRQIKEDRKIMKAMADELAAMKAKMNQVLNLIDMSKKAAFPDVPEDHWAKDAVDTLHGNGSLKGYPDGKFHGDQAMTRYEYAQMLFEAIKKGAHVDQNTLNEYSSELAQIKANQK